MKVILLTALLATAATTARADAIPSTVHSETAELRQAETALRAARNELVAARTHWDAAVSGDHPNPAGAWARRHFAAMQQVKVAERRWQAAKEQTDGSALASRDRH
jgi:hypothetical protein